MLAWQILAAALSLGQTPEPLIIAAAFPVPAPPAAAPAAVPPAVADRWLLMKSLQGTWPGAVLDSERMQLLGWTEASFTAGSAQNNNLPLGFNYRASEFAIQQNWF